MGEGGGGGGGDKEKQRPYMLSKPQDTLTHYEGSTYMLSIGRGCLQSSFLLHR